MTAKTYKYDAFFIKPSKSQKEKSGKGKSITPEIIGVPQRHIVTVCQNPDVFGLDMKKDIAPVYKKHGEQMPFEGHARNEVILSLLKPPQNFVRVRHNARRGTWVVQVYEEINKTVRQSIHHFLVKIKEGVIRDMLQRSSYPYYNIEIIDTREQSLFSDKVDEGIAFLSK